MRKLNLSDLTIDQLVARFSELGTEQDRAERTDNPSKYDRLFWQMEAVKNELKARPGDSRSALVKLYDHPNMQVRLKAAKATLAVAPIAARAVIEAIADSRSYPQAGDAGMCLANLDAGVFKPT